MGKNACSLLHQLNLIDTVCLLSSFPFSNELPFEPLNYAID